MPKKSASPVTQSILPIRFTVRDREFNHVGANILTIDWMKEASRVANFLATQNKARDGKVYLPTVSLDTALSAMNPVVAHGFRFLDEDYSLHYTLSVNEHPNPALIANLSAVWADTWAKYHFPNGLKHGDFLALRGHMAEPGVWQQVSAHEALYDSHRDKLRYSLVPSLLSVLFASQGPSRLGDQMVTWGLAQQAENNGWQVVSSPIPGKNNATYAYLLRFSVQYQAGIDVPRIHVAIICQRYADNPVAANGGRRISMLCRLGRPLMAQGIQNDNLIRLAIHRNATEGLSFGSGFPDILMASQARALADPAEILASPRSFRGEQSGDDRYLVVHFEGLETELDVDDESEDEEVEKTTGGHGIGTGFSLTERWEIYQTILERLGNLLAPSGTLPHVDIGQAMRSTTAWSRSSKGKNAKSEKYLEAFRVANRGAATIVLLYHTEGLGKVMQFFVRRLFNMGKDEAWPEWLTVKCERIPDELARKLEVPESDKEKRGVLRAETERALSNAWRVYLQKYRAERVYTWVELPSANSFTSPHDAIRDACVQSGFASQMLAPMPAKLPVDILMNMGKNFKNGLANKTFGRMFNALADLLLRQSGTTWPTAWVKDAVNAGFPKTFAEQFSVVGITVFRANRDYRTGRGEVTVPTAVRMNPDGTVQMFWGDGWIDYYSAAMQIGKFFADTSRRAKAWNDDSTAARNKRVNSYFQSVLQSIRNTPTLLIVDAVKIRNYVKSLKVGELKPQALNFGTAFDVMTHPNLVAVWARFDSAPENIQYVGQGGDGGVEKVADHSLFLDEDACGVFDHYYSLGRQLPGSEKVEDGYRYQLEKPETRYRYQQAIELVPFFGDKQWHLPAVIFTHGLRFSPHFPLSSITAPYPVHLSKALMRDMVCLLGVLPDDTEN